MKKLKINLFKVSVFLLTLIFTFILRAHNYEKTPVATHLDEMLYAWSGLYLIETGVPVSWSTLDYPKRAEVYKGEINYKGGEPKTSVTLYKPWLDQPPLFSMIVGYFAHIYHANRNEFIPSSYIRIPTVILASLTSIMIFLIAKYVSGYWLGILSMLIYGTVPIMVFGSRTALPENLIALIFTIIAYLLLKFYKEVRTVYLLPIPILVAVAGLAKPTGFFLLLLVVLIIFKKFYEASKLKSAVSWISYIVLATLPFIGGFIWYGLRFDPEIFWRITSIQSFRPVGFNSLGWFFISPAYRTSILTDSWYIFCLLSSAYFIFAPKTGIKKMISLFFIFWVSVVMLTGGEGDLLPWYRYPAFPFLAILGAWGLQQIVQRVNLFTVFLAAGLLLGARSLVVNAFHPNVMPSEYRIIFIALILPSILWSIFQKPWLYKLTKILMIFTIMVGIYFNVLYIYNEFEITCESKSCPMVPSTVLSTLHFPFIWRWLVIR